MSTLARIFGDNSGPVLLYGEAGVGKTNLVLEALREASMHGMRGFYLSTEGSQYVARVLQLGGMDNVLFSEALSLGEQTRIILWGLPRIAGMLRIVVVDTINSLYRLDAGEGERAFIHLGAQMASLYRLASRGVMVVVTGQVHGEGDEASGMWLTRFWAKKILRVERRGDSRVMRCVEPCCAEHYFVIERKGIRWLNASRGLGAEPRLSS